MSQIFGQCSRWFSSHPSSVRREDQKVVDNLGDAAGQNGD
jgi:hypothetical protein